MLRNVASKVAWVGKTASMVFGLALVMALILGAASTALGKNGQSLILGKATNTATKVTGIIGKVATGSAFSITNPSGGSALGLQVNAGRAPLTVNQEAGTAANLSADELDGKDSSELQGRVGGECAAGSSIRSIGAEGAVTCETDDGGGKAPDSELLDGKDSAEFLGANQKAADADKLDNKDSADFASAYKRTVVVSPVGTAAQNGTALKNALSGITNASEGNPYLLKIEPGVYDLGAAPGLQMKSWVDIEGSGEGVTTLTSTGSLSFFTGTVVGAPNSEMRLLTVKNTGGSYYAVAVYSGTAGPLRLTHVTAAASGGIYASLGARLDTGTVTLNQATADASGNSQNIGVFVGSGGKATLIQATASASGGAESFGFSKNSDNAMEIRESRIVGGTNTVRNFGGTGTIRVGGSQLSGGGPAEATTCAGVYDENYSFFASTCP